MNRLFTMRGRLRPAVIAATALAGLVVLNRPATFSGGGVEHAAQLRVLPPPAGRFPVGVYQQPITSFGMWAERGVNTLVGVPEGQDVEAWIAAARREGLSTIRPPRADVSRDLGDADLLAWLHPDEPEINRERSVDLRQKYLRLKELNPFMPVLVNFSGGVVLGLQGRCDEFCYRQYISSADWISSDIYPVAGWGRPEQLGWVGRAIDRLEQWSDGRPLFAFIETSFLDERAGVPGARGVTPDEFRAQVWNAVIHGARGIWYFPIAFRPFRFDATPPSVVEEMTRQNALLADLAPVLQGRVDPPPTTVSAAQPIETGWRADDKATYVLAVNLSDRSGQYRIAVDLGGAAVPGVATVYGEGRTVVVSEGVIRDEFRPHDVHIYVLPRRGTA